MNVRISSLNPTEKQKRLLISLFAQTNKTEQIWRALEPYKINFENQEYTLILTNTIIKRSSKKGDSRYEVVSKEALGKGAYGEVYPIDATYKMLDDNLVDKKHQYGTNRVVKIFGNRALSIDDIVEYADTEYKMTNQTLHTHPKKPIRYEENVYNIFRRMEGRELFDILSNDLTAVLEKQIPLEIRWDLTFALLKAMEEQVTACNLVHRDLKPDNIMIDFKDNKIILNIIDYGLSKLKDTYTLNEQVGTIGYMSPESLRNEHTTELSDVYSLGQILRLLWHPADITPFTKNLNIPQALKIAEKKDIPPLFNKLEGINPQVAEIIRETLKQMTAFEPKDRMTLAQAYNNFTHAKILQFPGSAVILESGEENSSVVNNHNQQRAQNNTQNMQNSRGYPACRFFKNGPGVDRNLENSNQPALYNF